jgi:hypothetical protein
MLTPVAVDTPAVAAPAVDSVAAAVHDGWVFELAAAVSATSKLQPGSPHVGLTANSLLCWVLVLPSQQ